MRKLRTKLLLNNLITLSATFIVFGVLVTYGLTHLSTRFLELNQKRANEVKASLTDIFSGNQDRIKSIYQTALENKGRGMVEKDGASILPMIEDNAFGSLRDFLRKNFSHDSELVLAEFFTVEEKQVKAWQIVSPLYSNGVNLPIEYSPAKQSWSALDSKNKKISVLDPEVPSLVELKQPSIILKSIEVPDELGQMVPTQVYDCVIPIYKKGTTKGSPLGFLRYVLSLKKMEKTLADIQANLNARMLEQEQANTQALTLADQVTGDSLRSAFLLLVLSAIIVFVLSFLLAGVLSRKLTVPVIALTEVAERMAAGNYKQDITVKSDDEIGILAQSFQEMSHAITKRDEDLAEINRNLEKLVEQRTYQLREEMKKVSNLLNNMKQAVFAISNDGKVIAPVSHYSKELFGISLEGKSVYESLFKDLDRGSQEFSAVHTAMVTVFHEGDLQWDLMEGLFPKQIEYIYPDSDAEKRTLKVSYTPLWDDSALLEHLLVVVQDITEVLKLEKRVVLEKASSARSIQMIQEMAAVPVDELRNYFLNSWKLLEETAQLTQSEAMLRNLHTLKGNSRAFNFSLISNLVHRLENEIAHPPKESDRTFNGGLEEVQNQVQEYALLAKKVFRIDGAGEWGGGASSGVKMIEVVETHLQELREKMRDLQMNKLFDRLLEYPLKQSLAKFVPMTSDIGNELGKQVQLKVKGEDLMMNRDRLQQVNDSILHILRNAIDHGIESPEERISLGKPERGTIEIECLKSGSGIELRIRDDGRGINIAKVVERAATLGKVDRNQISNLSEEEKLDLVFLSGVTTRDSVSEISGRGLGMDVVKANLEKCGGKIALQTTLGKGTELRITLGRLDA